MRQIGAILLDNPLAGLCAVLGLNLLGMLGLASLARWLDSRPRKPLDDNDCPICRASSEGRP